MRRVRWSFPDWRMPVIRARARAEPRGVAVDVCVALWRLSRRDARGRPPHRQFRDGRSVSVARRTNPRPRPHHPGSRRAPSCVLPPQGACSPIRTRQSATSDSRSPPETPKTSTLSWRACAERRRTLSESRSPARRASVRESRPPACSRPPGILPLVMVLMWCFIVASYIEAPGASRSH